MLQSANSNSEHARFVPSRCIFLLQRPLAFFEFSPARPLSHKSLARPHFLREKSYIFFTDNNRMAAKKITKHCPTQPNQDRSKTTRKSTLNRTDKSTYKSTVLRNGLYPGHNPLRCLIKRQNQKQCYKSPYWPITQL